MIRTGLALCLAAQLAHAGPIEVYREGPRYCPHDRGTAAPVISEAEAVDRARALLPARYCGPSTFVSGCDVLAEYALGSWRIYFHQYRMRGRDRDWGGLMHTYIVLDPRGNCYANIPGTAEGATR
ncbi:MAG: hypothetical protein ACM3JC_10170 [Rudaea sp.]